jgi:hypothetical protein
MTRSRGASPKQRRSEEIQPVPSIDVGRGARRHRPKILACGSGDGLRPGTSSVQSPKASRANNEPLGVRQALAGLSAPLRQDQPAKGGPLRLEQTAAGGPLRSCVLGELAGAQRPANVKQPRPCGGVQGRSQLQLERIWGLLELQRPKPLGGMAGRRPPRYARLTTPATVPAMTSLRPPCGASQPPATPTQRSRLATPPRDHHHVTRFGDCVRFNAAIDTSVGADPRAHRCRRYEVAHRTAPSVCRQRHCFLGHPPVAPALNPFWPPRSLDRRC